VFFTLLVLYQIE